MEGRGDGPQGRAVSRDSSWRVGVGPWKRRTWKVQGEHNGRRGLPVFR